MFIPAFSKTKRVAFKFSLISGALFLEAFELHLSCISSIRGVVMFGQDRINSTKKVLTAALLTGGMFLSQGCEAKGWSKFKSFFKPQEITKNVGVTEEDYKSFKVIMKMYKIVDKERRKAKRHGRDVWSGREAHPGPNPYYNQTKKGFFIEGHSHLHTPFGEVQLTYSDDSLSFRQSLFKRLKTKFSHIWHRYGRHYGNKPLKYYVLKSNDTDLRAFWDVVPNSSIHAPKEYHDLFDEVPDEEIHKVKGQDVHMECNYAGHYPVYELLEIEGQKLPKPERQSQSMKNCRYQDLDDVENAWKAMEKRFKREKILKPLLSFRRWRKSESL